MGRVTNKARREGTANTAREKAAAARAEQQRADQRRRALMILSVVVVVAVVIAVVAVVALTRHSKSTSASSAASAASAAVVSDVSSVTPATAATIGAGSSAVAMKPISGPPLTVNGKPDLLYVGAEFCPFCAAERWSLIQSLSRFGTFTGLKEIRSSEDDLPTFDFKDATYTSKYLTFSPREIEDQNSKPLQPLSTSQQALFTKYSPGGSFPFIYVGGKYVQSGAGFTPTVLTGLTQKQVAAELNDPSSTVAKAIVGEANVVTAAICGTTNNQPSNVCSTPTISALQTKINANPPA